jgi:hypothetical protein
MGQTFGCLAISFSSCKTSFFEQQFRIGKKVEPNMVQKLEGECEFYNRSLFP